MPTISIEFNRIFSLSSSSIKIHFNSAFFLLKQNRTEMPLFSKEYAQKIGKNRAISGSENAK